MICLGRFIDLTGQKFGRLTVIERAPNQGEYVRWKCRCDCGGEVTVQSASLISGRTQSCGCLARERARETALNRIKDLTGQKFGRLTVIGRAKNKGKRVRWLCRCKCGTKCIVDGSSLKSGKTRSCGCLHDERAVQTNTTHGMRHSSTYNTWASIKQRCLNSNCHAYKDYGGRGITMFPAWVSDFQAFYDYVSKLPCFSEKGYTLDRINNDGNYEPGNLRWADRKTQARNTRSKRIVEYDGELMTLVEAAEKSGIEKRTLWARIKAGDTGDRLFRAVRHLNKK